MKSFKMVSLVICLFAMLGCGGGGGGGPDRGTAPVIEKVELYRMGDVSGNPVEEFAEDEELTFWVYGNDPDKDISQLVVTIFYSEYGITYDYIAHFPHP
jgi:hypothetical protein